MKRWCAALALGCCLALPVQAKEYIYACGTGQVAVVDPSSLAVVASIPIKGAAPFMVVSKDRKHLYMPTGGRELIQIVDTATNKVTRTMSLSDPNPAHRVRAFIFALAVDNQEKYLYAYVIPTTRVGESLTSGKPQIVTIDLASGKKVKSVDAPIGVASMTPSTDGKTIYLFSRDIFAFDTATQSIRKYVDVVHPGVQGEGDVDYIQEWTRHREGGEMAATPYFTLDPISGRYFLGVMTLDLKTGAFDKLEAGPAEQAMVPFSAILSPDQKMAYLVFNQMLVMDRAARKVVASNSPLPRSYAVMTISADGKRIYATGGATLLEYDAQGLKALREVDLPADFADMVMVDK